MQAIFADEFQKDFFRFVDVVFRGKIGKAKGVCKVGGDIVSEAEVTFMLRDA